MLNGIGTCVLAALLIAGAGGLEETWSGFQTGEVLPERSISGEWYTQFSGYGTVRVVSDPQFGRALELAPKASEASSETHAALVTSLRSFEDFDAAVHLATIRQLRAHSPNASETGWVLWHFSDASHFYYFILKPNGWELGKEDPAFPGSQRFLASGASPVLAFGAASTLRIVQRSATIQVFVDGHPVVTFTDGERPYLLGSLGLYCEDSIVRFGPVQVSPL